MAEKRTRKYREKVKCSIIISKKLFNSDYKVNIQKQRIKEKN